MSSYILFAYFTIFLQEEKEKLLLIFLKTKTLKKFRALNTQKAIIAASFELFSICISARRIQSWCCDLENFMSILPTAYVRRAWHNSVRSNNARYIFRTQYTSSTFPVYEYTRELREKFEEYLSATENKRTLQPVQPILNLSACRNKAMPIVRKL